VGLRDLPGFDPPALRRKPGSQIKNFTEWIEHEPLERWSLLHDTHGARYDIMTTNLTESYKFVLRGNRALPLTTIMEGIFYGTMKYFKERCEEAVHHELNNPNTPYYRKIAIKEQKFEVRLQTDKFGTSNEIRTHEVKIGNEVWPKCECTCNKPMLLHLPCSDVFAACRML
jgi:hypothetical protein